MVIVSISVHLEERNMHVVVKYYQSLCVLIIGTFSINSQAVYYLVNTVLNNQDSEYHSDNCPIHSTNKIILLGYKILSVAVSVAII